MRVRNGNGRRGDAGRAPAGTPLRLVARLSVTATLVGASLAIGCAAAIQETGGRHSQLSAATVRLHDHDLTIHLSQGYGPTAPLLVYLTGDGGWIGKDKELFNRLVPYGYPLAGISAREYISHLGNGVTVEPPEQVADDVSDIVAAAERALGLPPDGRVVLVGKSRGADLAVVAAWASSRLRPRLQGVVAIALTPEEEHVRLRIRGPADGSAEETFGTYDALPDISTRIALIQSSNDHYIRAAQARERFGPEAPRRRFRAVEAHNHSFAGALPDLYREVLASLDWLLVPDVTAGRAQSLR